MDRHLAGPAVQPAGRRRPPAERADRAVVRGQLRHHRHQGARRSTASCGSGATRRWPAWPRAQTLTLGPGDGTLGYEWDAEPDNGFRPAGLFDLSSTTSTSAEVFTDYGSTVQAASTATHHLSLYRAPSGALVFGAGTVQWSWGLDNPSGDTADREHAAGHGQPVRRHGRAAVDADHRADARPRASTDTTAPTSTITSPAGGADRR